MDFLDELTRESIDFDYVLSKIRTRTPYGKGYKEEMRPFPWRRIRIKRGIKKNRVYH